MITESDRLMGQLVVAEGLITNDQLQGYLHEVEGGRRPPNSLIGLLTQSGRLTPDMMNKLRQRWQEAQAGRAGAPAAADAPAAMDSPAAPSPSASGSDPRDAKIQKLVQAGVIDAAKAQLLRATLDAWKAQGRDVEVPVAIVYLQMATQEQVDQALNGAAPSTTSSSPGMASGTGRFNNLGDEGRAASNEFMSPVGEGDRSQSQYASRRYQAVDGSSPSAFSPLGGSGEESGAFDQTISDAPAQQLLDASRRGSGSFSAPSGFSNPSGMTPAFVDSSNFGPAASGTSPFASSGPASSGAAPFGPAASSPFTPAVNSSGASPFASGASPFSSNSPAASASAPSGFANPAFATPASSGASPFASASPSASSSPFSSAPRVSDSASKTSGRRKKSVSGRSGRQRAANAPNKNKQRRKGGTRKKGFPVLPVTIGGSIAVILLGSILFFVVLPLRRARGLYDEAIQLQADREYRQALDKVDQIQAGMLPDETLELRDQLRRAIQDQTEKWVADIDDLIDLAKLDPAKLKEAEDLLKTALQNCLDENRENLRERFESVLVASGLAIEALDLSKEKKFNEALAKVRAINKDDLVGEFKNTENDILSSLKKYIREFSEEKIYPAARTEDQQAVSEALEALQAKYDDAVAANFQDVRNKIDEIRSGNKNKRIALNLLPRMRELNKEKKYAEIYQTLRSQDRGVIDAVNELKQISTIADRIIITQVNVLFNRCCVQAKTGDVSGAEFTFRDEIKNKIGLQLSEPELASYCSKIRQAAAGGQPTPPGG